MKKTILCSLSTILLVTMLCFSTSSCSNDDDDEVDSTILGTWEEQNYIDGVWQWSFNSNGKGECKVVDGKFTYTFSYDFSFKGNLLTVSGIESGKRYTDYYSVTISSNGKTMTWVDKDGGHTTTFKKVK